MVNVKKRQAGLGMDKRIRTGKDDITAQIRHTYDMTGSIYYFCMRYAICTDLKYSTTIQVSTEYINNIGIDIS
jgi:hypothetical protein